MLYKNDNGVSLFPGIDTVNQNVFLVTLSHPDAYPQMDFKLVDKIDAMLREKFVESSTRPRDWEDLVNKLHIVPVNTGTFAPYCLPYKNWQRAFYVAGEAAGCQNFVMELDNCIVYTVEHNEKPKYGQFPLKVQLGRNLGFEFAAEDFDYPHVEITGAFSAAEMAVTPLQVYPPQGVRPLMVQFEVVNAREVAMTFFGDTYRHRQALGFAGLEMSKEEPTVDSVSQHGGGSKRIETFYLMASKDISVESESGFVTKLLTDDVENVIIHLRVISHAAENTAAYTFVERLKQIPNLLVTEDAKMQG